MPMAHSPKIKRALQHPDEPGAGAAARRKAGLSVAEYIQADMAEFRRKTLRSGDGRVVQNQKQAVAIAINEGRRHGK